MCFLRARPRVSLFARGTWDRIEGWKPRNDGRPRTLLLSAPVGRFANCRFDGAAGRRAAVCQELLESLDGRPRFSPKRNSDYLRGLNTPGLAARAIRALYPRFAGGGKNRAAGGILRHFDANSLEPQQHLEPRSACEWRRGRIQICMGQPGILRNHGNSSPDRARVQRP